MKAVRFHEYGSVDVLRHEEVPEPTPAEDEVLVRVRACAVNHVAVDMRDGSSRLPLSLPHTLGFEVRPVQRQLGYGFELDRPTVVVHPPAGLVDPHVRQGTVSNEILPLNTAHTPDDGDRPRPTRGDAIEERRPPEHAVCLLFLARAIGRRGSRMLHRTPSRPRWSVRRRARRARPAAREWREAGCSMCLGMNPDVLAPGERCASTSNRNFEGRQGRGGGTHLVSPEMAAAAAIAGRFVDVRELDLEAV